MGKSEQPDPPLRVDDREAIPAPDCPRNEGQRLRAWVEIDAAAIAANARRLRQLIGASTRLMAVVKADGYGHGAVTAAQAALAGGAEELGVATTGEGITLRQAGLHQPILVLSSLNHPHEVRRCLQWQLMPTINDIPQAQLFHQLATGSGQSIPVHLKLDTGMGRLGAPWQMGRTLVETIRQLPGLELQGVYSHLAAADEPDHNLTRQQKQRFDTALQAITQAEGQRPCSHLANSAATLGGLDLGYDMVRTGLALYGHAPAPHLEHTLPLQPAMTVQARVTLLRSVPAGTGVSYNHRYRTVRPSRLAVVGIGYGDGVPRRMSGRMSVLHQEQRLPQVGAITMDQLILDATDCPALARGDVVTLLGGDGNTVISPMEWSRMCDSIPWEVLCGFKSRLPRLSPAEDC